VNTAGSILASEIIEHRLELAGLPHGWPAVASVVLLGILLYVVVLLYRREQRAGATAGMRALLATLRCSVVLLIAMIWLQPIIATYIRRDIQSPTLLLVDGSASMSLRDRYPDQTERQRVIKALDHSNDADPGAMTRARIAQALLAQSDEQLLRELSAGNPVLLYQFGNKLTALGEFSAASWGMSDSRQARPGLAAEAQDRTPATQPVFLAPLSQATAPATDIAAVVRQAVEGQAGRPISAIVVISDGQFNQGEPPEAVARYAQSKRIPIYAVGLGDPAPPRNAAVASVEAPANVFVNDPFKVTARLRAQGLAGATCTVELRERLPDAADWSMVTSRDVRVSPDGRLDPVTFSHQLRRAAQARLEVRIRPLEGETILDDNQRQISVRALDNKMRVLLVAGEPSWEYRYLSRLLIRDATVDVSCWLQSADETAVRDGNTIIDHFPRKPEELAIYDCIILLDPQPGDFDAAFNSTVEKLVTQIGCGLLYVAGKTNTPGFAHEVNARPLLDLLPVVIDAGQADLIINELGLYQQTAWPLVVPPQAAGSPVLAMSDQPGESAQIWARLPGVYWHYPVTREKPVATVLLRHSNPQMRNAYGQHVILASQFLGAGRTAFLACEDTWRWRRFGDRYFNRFWIQLLRHLVEGKLLAGQRRGLIQLDRDQCAVGESVDVQARLLDATFSPLRREQVEMTVTPEGQSPTKVVLKAQPDRPGWYRGQFTPTGAALHELQIDLPAEGNTPSAAVRGELRVGQPDLEFRQTPLDRQSLASLASESAGGQYLNVDEIDKLPSLIPSRTTSLIITGQPVSLWDRWWVLAVLVILLATEWSLRKISRML
jgi:hypothetical protein